MKAGLKTINQFIQNTLLTADMLLDVGALLFVDMFQL